MNGLGRSKEKELRERVVSFLAEDWPNLLYVGTAMRTCLGRLLNKYPRTYRVDLAPMIEDFEKYEFLFEDSLDNFGATVAPYTKEFKWFLGRIYNGALSSVDLELYYSMIRRHRPDLVIEVGCGHSSCIAAEGMTKNRRGHLICVDPSPRRKVPSSAEHIRTKVEDMDIGLFRMLKKNDILFIDSSHSTEEAAYHTQVILPNLEKGVLIHHHDFTYPYGVYYCDDPIRFGEPDVLLRFYEENKESFEILVAASYVRYKTLELLRHLVKSYKWNTRRIPGSLWTRKREKARSSWRNTR